MGNVYARGTACECPSRGAEHCSPKRHAPPHIRWSRRRQCHPAALTRVCTHRLSLGSHPAVPLASAACLTRAHALLCGLSRTTLETCARRRPPLRRSHVRRGLVLRVSELLRVVGVPVRNATISSKVRRSNNLENIAALEPLKDSSTALWRASRGHYDEHINRRLRVKK